MTEFWHQVKHGVPADLRRTDGSGFKLAPPSTAQPHSAADVLADVLGNLVGVCSATNAGTAERMATEHAVAYTLALYGAQDHEEAVAVVQRTMHRYNDGGGYYDIDRIVDGLIDHVW
jgi:hypothetical protein